MGKPSPSRVAGGNVSGANTLENCFQFLLKWGVHLLSDPAVLLLEEHPTERLMRPQHVPFTGPLTAALFPSHNQEQPNSKSRMNKPTDVATSCNTTQQLKQTPL